MQDRRVWDCQVGWASEEKLSPGADAPMRVAVREAFEKLVGRSPDFCASGWGGFPELQFATTEELFDELLRRVPATSSEALLVRLRLANARRWLSPEMLAQRGRVASSEPADSGWCGPDNCPIELCDGPHVEHSCLAGSITTMRLDQLPCMLCGWVQGGEA